MLNYIKGDIIEAADAGEFQVLIHGCNCFHKMGAGIARSLVARWPEILQADISGSECGDPGKLGNFTTVKVEGNSGPILVINAYTQFNYGRDPKQRYVQYSALQKAMYLADGLCEGTIVGMPMIGAGLAGGDWDIISKIISKTLYTSFVNIYFL